ncbi:hypothetical protein [Vallitalea sp.]|jgi:hypothetical protein|uniref:hypothetical protein n=1 Tax=Vallitalea sp. TaxID=1882829 RepID=UPI0025CDA2AE|nr:hypothetical protein [Vallitalea sp.]MCT4685699.1 hypothetical protein [Vallitalea sp.]
MKYLSLIIIVFLSCVDSIGQRLNYKETFKYTIYNSIRKNRDSSEFMFVKYYSQDTIVLSYYSLKNITPFFIIDYFMVRKNKNLCLEGVTELRNSSIRGEDYSTIDNLCDYENAVPVCVKEIEQDTFLCNRFYTYNVYEIYYTKYSDCSGEYDLRLFIDLKQGVILRKEYFSREYIFQSEELVKVYSH